MAAPLCWSQVARRGAAIPARGRRCRRSGAEDTDADPTTLAVSGGGAPEPFPGEFRAEQLDQCYPLARPAGWHEAQEVGRVRPWLR